MRTQGQWLKCFVNSNVSLSFYDTKFVMNYLTDNKIEKQFHKSPLILLLMIMIYWTCFVEQEMFINLENKTFCTWHMMWKVWVAKSQLSYSIVVNRLSMVFELEDEKRNLKLRRRSLPFIGILSNLEISSSDKNGSASLPCNLIGGNCWMVFI